MVNGSNFQIKKSPPDCLPTGFRLTEPDVIFVVALSTQDLLLGVEENIAPRTAAREPGEAEWLQG